MHAEEIKYRITNHYRQLQCCNSPLQATTTIIMHGWHCSPFNIHKFLLRLNYVPLSLALASFFSVLFWQANVLTYYKAQIYRKLYEKSDIIESSRWRRNKCPFHRFIDFELSSSVFECHILCSVLALYRIVLRGTYIPVHLNNEDDRARANLSGIIFAYYAYANGN